MPDQVELAPLEKRRDEARAVTEDLLALEDFGVRRTLHGYYYMAQYPPLRAMRPVSGQEAERLLGDIADQVFDTYLHFPFCEYICTFCHFHKRPMGSPATYGAREAEALDLIESEIFRYRELLGGPLDARSLQIGGGTPSLISNERLARLLRHVHANVEFRPGSELKMEIYPQDYEQGVLREKLRILKDNGFSNVVVDLESGNARTLKFINRPRSSLDAFLRVVEVCVDEGFDSIITALMAGLPHETFESLDDTLQTMLRIPEIERIHVFPLILRQTDPIHVQYQREPEVFHDARARDDMWLFARNTLRSAGFVESPVSCLRRTPAQRKPVVGRQRKNLLGFGTSAFGYLAGSDWTGPYYNFCNPADYAKRVVDGELPIWRFAHCGDEESARFQVIRGLSFAGSVNLADLQDDFGVSVDELYGRLFNALLRLGLIELDPANRGIRYTEHGLARTEELTYFLGSDRVKDEGDRLPDKDDPHYRELVDQHYATMVPIEDRTRFEAFVAEQEPSFLHRVA